MQEGTGRTKQRSKLIAQRCMYGMTQAYLAKCTGLAQTTISAIERGKVMPRPGTLRRIASTLHFDWREFYRNEGVQI